MSLTEAFDLTTPTGCAMASMVAVFAEFEREIRRERMTKKYGSFEGLRVAIMRRF